jgi:hypothetical protein
MMPAAPAARRLSTLGCAVLAALSLAACGSGGGVAAETGDAALTPPTAQTRPQAPSRPCPGQLSGFVAALDSLRRQLAVGLNYEQYAVRIRDLRASYDEIPVARLTIGCLAQTGTPGERALNRYVDAANTWGECLADASCSTGAVEPVLQRKWRAASGFLAEAR